MPSRTYTGIDLVNYTEEFISNEGNVVTIASPAGQGRATISGSGSGSFPNQGSVNRNVNCIYKMMGELDFNVFPAVPNNALITNVRIKINGTVFGIASAAADSSSGPCCSDSNANGRVGIVVERNGEQFLDGLFTGNEATDSDSGVTSGASISISESNPYMQEEIFDFSGAPISKATLVTMFTTIAFYLGTINNIVENADSGSSSNWSPD